LKNDIIIEIEHVYKSFGRVQAVVDVSLNVYKRLDLSVRLSMP